MATTINIALPDSLKSFVDAKTAEGHFETPADYVRDVIEGQQRRQKDLETFLLARLAEESDAFEIPDHIVGHEEFRAFLEEQDKKAA